MGLEIYLLGQAQLVGALVLKNLPEPVQDSQAQAAIYAPFKGGKVRQVYMSDGYIFLSEIQV